MPCDRSPRAGAASLRSRITRKAQFCALPADGARIAASRTWVISASGTGSGLNRRSDRAVWIASKSPMSGIGQAMLRVAISNVPLLRFGRIEDPLQLLLHQRLPRRLEAAPLAERRHHPRGDLAVHRIQRDDGVGQEAIAAAGRHRGTAPGCRRRSWRPARARGSGCADRSRRASPARAPHPACPAAATSPGWRTTCPAPDRRRASAHGTRRAPRAAPDSRSPTAPPAPPARRSCSAPHRTAPWPARCRRRRRPPRDRRGRHCAAPAGRSTAPSMRYGPVSVSRS